MAKSIVFLVHGIGIHEEGWVQDQAGPVQALTKAAEHYSGFGPNEPLTDAVEFVEIRYDDIFDGIRQRWAALAEGLGASSLPGRTPELLQQVGSAIVQGGGGSVVATHVLDVGLYTGFRIVQRLVQLKVAALMMSKISGCLQEPEGSRSFVVVAHSFGTTVAHDAIQRMATSGWLADADRVRGLLQDSGLTLETFQHAVDRYGPNPFAPGNFKFDAIFQISNTSRLFSRTKPAYDSSVRPMFSGGPMNNAVRRFYNADHVLDPAGKIRKHRAKEAWPVSATNFTAVDLFDIDHIHDINVHDLGHYLSHPLVHAHLLFAAAPTRFKLADFQQAMGRVAEGGDFPRFGSKFLDEDLRNDIEGLLSALSPNTLDRLPDAIEPQVRTFLGGIDVPGNVMNWLKTAVGLKGVLDELKGRLT
jgi:hypothetical protein